jgi:hypothetical protein
LLAIAHKNKNKNGEYHMGKMARSARGEIVDFDLIAIRQQLANAVPTVEVSSRREYIDNKEAGRPAKESILNPISVAGDASTDEFENSNLAEE